MERIVLIIALAVGSALPALASDPLTAAMRPCVVERLERAAAACIAAIADERLARLEVRLSAMVSEVQGATGAEIRALEATLGETQTRWHDLTEAHCDPLSMDGPVAYETCRLTEVLMREDSVDELYARSVAPLIPVPTPQIRVPDEVEVLVPLDTPATIGGPDATVRLPLSVPVQP